MAIKPVRLSLSSTNEELLSTMNTEGKHVVYWHKKHYGGPRKYDKWQDEQLAKVQELPGGSEIVGEMVDYHSLVTGNRWKSFEVTSGYGEGNAYTRMLKFCYWDTYGSVGAFYNCKTADMKYCQLLVFPSHFFLRYADRMGIQHRDAALVCEFFNRNHAFAIAMREDVDEKGRRQCIISVKEGVCYGFVRTTANTPEELCERDNVFEVRTFLKYEQLNNRQRKECEKVRELADYSRLTDGAPAIHSIGRAIKDEGYAEKMREHSASMLNLTKKQFKQMENLFYAVTNITDFVSGDLRKFLKFFTEGKTDTKSQEDFIRLLQIIAGHIKDNPNFYATFSFHTLVILTHEWKGDDYDWNKWFWSFLRFIQERVSNEEDKAQYEPLKEQCKRGEFTYKQIEAIGGNSTKMSVGD